MRAYNLAMFMIFLNCGFAIMLSINNGMFFASPDEGGMTTQSDELDEMKSTSNIYSVMQAEIFTIPGLDITINVIEAVAGVLAVAAAVLGFFGGQAASGVAIGGFAIVFWGSIVSTKIFLTSIATPEIDMFYNVFMLAATLIFIIALFQMTTGGQKSHV